MPFKLIFNTDGLVTALKTKNKIPADKHRKKAISKLVYPAPERYLTKIPIIPHITAPVTARAIPFAELFSVPVFWDFSSEFTCNTHLSLTQKFLLYLLYWYFEKILIMLSFEIPIRHISHKSFRTQTILPVCDKQHKSYRSFF